MSTGAYPTFARAPSRAALLLALAGGSLVVASPPTLLAALAGAPQQVAGTEDRGWLGVSLSRSEEPEAVYVAWVASGGPAALAGVRAGERIHRINGLPGAVLLDADPSRRPRYQVGDSVRLALSGDGYTKELVVIAAARAEAFASGPIELNHTPTLPSLVSVWPVLDTVWPSLYSAVDSLRMALIDADSLSQLMSQAMDSMADSMATSMSRAMGEFARSVGRNDVERLRADEALGSLDLSIGLSATVMDSLARGLEYLSLQLEAFSPLVPYALGRNRAAGAELAAIAAPSLGKYFGLTEGILVIDVPPGTPAARGGLASGDVIVMAAGEVVASVAALRTALARTRADGTSLLVVRAGENIEVTIPR